MTNCTTGFCDLHDLRGFLESSHDGSMGGLHINLDEWLIFMVNVGKCTIQEFYGIRYLLDGRRAL